MNGQIHDAVEEIFTGYVDTAELRELKEEIAANLAERVQDMMERRGMDREEALLEALEELGDVTQAADTVSRQKRNEIIGQMYGRGVALTRTHAIGYPVAGFLLALGLVLCALVAVVTGGVRDALATLMPIAAVSGGGFVFLGLTQETRTHLPMGWKRALLYAVATLLLLFGVFVSVVILFDGVYIRDLTGGGEDLAALLSVSPAASLGVLIPFVLPALALFVFLGLTERPRKKPWVLRMEARQAKLYAHRFDERFGVLCGALWMFALGLFVVLGFLVSWAISWVVFIFAIAVQCLIQFFMMKKEQ